MLMNIRKKHVGLINVFLLILLFTVKSSFSAAGDKYWYRKPFLKNYATREYKGHSQVWAITQDKRGIMYFANSSNGILEYDGVDWITIPVLSSSVIRSVSLGRDGRVYAGGISELGYIKVVNGKSRYVSLVEKIPAAKRHFGDVWQIIPTDFGVYFRTHAGFFRWYKDKMEIIGSGDIFYTSAYIKGKIFTLVRNKGLFAVNKNKILKLPITKEVLERRLNIYAMLPYGNDILLAVRDKGLFIYDGQSIKPFESEADDFLRRNKIYTACNLPDGMLAFGTKEGGIVIIDKEGKIDRILNRENTLNDNTIRSLFMDNQNGLWVGMNNGIARFEINSPYCVYTNTDGLLGLVNSVIIHDKRLYAATTLGLFRQKENLRTEREFFEKVANVGSEPRALLSVGDELFVGTNTGLHVIDARFNTKYFIRFHTNIYWLKKSSKFNDVIFAGTSNGFMALTRKNNIWQKLDIKVLQNIKVYNFEEDDSGSIWISSQPGVIYVLSFKKGNLNNPIIKEYNATHGLSLSKTFINKTHGRIYITTSEGVYRPSSDFKRLKKVTIISGKHNDISIDKIIEKNGSEVFIIGNSYNDVFLAKKGKDGKYIIKKSFLFGSRNITVNDAIVSKDKSLWFCGLEEIIHLSGFKRKIERQAPQIIIRKVSVGNTVVFGQGSMSPLLEEVNIEYRKNSIAFHYGLTSYNASEANRYQYQLEGHSARWSDWTSETRMKFSGLREGSYTFYVRAKDVFGNKSNVVSFVFNVLPPWYRTNLAYFIYLTMIILLFFAMVKIRSYRLETKAEILKKERDVLDKAVKDRTRELRDAYDIIKKDLKLAWRIQNNFISKDYKNYKELDVEVYFSPMIEVGGDIYDIFKVKEGVFRVFIGDATGHGIQAALTTMIIKSEYDKIKIIKLPPNELLRIFNNVFMKNYYHLTVFFTCVIVDIDLNNKEISFASAGHPDQYLISGGKLNKVQAGGSMIGLFENAEFENKKIKISGDEKIILFTDGLFEEFNHDGEEYGEKRLEERLLNSIDVELPEIINSTVSDMRSFCKEINDDITFMGIKLVNNK